ncbi:hypothetical protein ACHAQH_006705 [Verticillium albo-atrum]
MAANPDQSGAPAPSSASLANALSQIMGNMQLPPNEPASPGPRIYAVRDLNNGAEEWIDPMLPSVDMNEDGQDVIEPFQPGFVPSGAQLDQLFASEELQMVVWGGLKSWEARLYGDIDAYVPPGAAHGPGEVPWYQAMALNIDESTWLDCFQRRCWTDFDREIKGWPGKFWHMGDDDVWGQMRPIIEIANRMLLTSIEGPWLGSALNDESYSFEANIFRMNGKREDFFRCNEATPQNRVSREEGRRLLNAALYPSVTWAFHDDEHAINDHAWAYCRNFGTNLKSSWISLWTDTFRENFDQSYVPGGSLLRRQTGKMTAAYMTAATICHELMHAACPPLTFAAWRKLRHLVPGDHRFFQGGWCEFVRLHHPARVILPPLRASLPDAIEDAQNRIAASLENYRLQWQQWRSPWYDDAFARWKRTPYCETMYRRQLITLHGRFRVRGPFAAYKALDEARWFISPIVHRRPVGPERAEHLWFWRAVGFLALAALPRIPLAAYVNQKPTVLQNAWRSQAKGLDNITRDALSISSAVQALRKTRELQWKRRGGMYLIREPRQWCLQQARAIFKHFREATSVPFLPALDAAFNLQVAKLTAQAQNRQWNQWLDFDFEMPVYTGQGTDLGPSQPRQGRGQRPRKGRGRQPGIRDFPQIRAKLAMVDDGSEHEKSDRMPNLQRMRYFTWGEIGNHQIGEGTGWWVLKKSGEEYDVYDISDVVSRLHIPDWLVRERVATRRFEDIPLRVLSADSDLAALSNTLADALKEMTPIGRALQYTRPEEVAFRDGGEGRDAWIMIGRNVYDISDLEIEDGDLRNRLLESAGGTLAEEPSDAGHDLIEVAEWLSPLKVRMLPTATSTCIVNEVFTAAEVAALNGSDLGLHTIIQGHVYALAEYENLHPGGLQILWKAAGHNSTEDFLRYHELNGEDMLKQVEHLRVGRVVEARMGGGIGTSEVRLLDSIYDIRALTLEPSAENADLLSELEEFAGSDATAVMQKAMESSDVANHPAHPLIRLVDMKSLIAARVMHSQKSSFGYPTPDISAADSEGDDWSSLPSPLNSPSSMNSDDIQEMTGENDEQNVLDHITGRDDESGEESGEDAPHVDPDVVAPLVLVAEGVSIQGPIDVHSSG